MRKSTFWSSGLTIAVLLSVLPAPAASAAAATDLGIRATVGSFRVGATGTYTVTVSNHGPATTDAPVHVLDALPDGLSFDQVVGNNFTCSSSGQMVDCVMTGPLTSGHSTTFRIYVSVCTAAYPSVTNTLQLDYPGDTNGANDSITKTKVVRAGSCTPPTASATQRPTFTSIPGTMRSFTPTPTSTPAAPATADLQLTKTTSSTFTVGGTGVYSLAVSNLGPAGTNAVIKIVDSLPTGLTFVSSSGPGWTCSAVAQTVTCTTQSLVPAGGSSAVALSVAVGSAAYPTVTNVAAVSYAGDPDTTNNTAQKPTTIRQ